MKRIKGLPVGLVALFAVVAMGAMGVAYAAWSTSVTINGTVTTGTLSVTASSAQTAFSGAPATCSSNVGPVTASASPASLSLTFANFVPGSSCTHTVTITNNGSIPAKVSSGAITVLTGGLSTNTTVDTGDCDGRAATTLDPTDSLSCTIIVELPDPTATAADMGKSATISLVFSVVQ